MTKTGSQTESACARPAPDGRTALLILDMINRFDFVGAENLRPRAATAARTIAALRATVEARDVPVIYVNDNYGEWHSERSRLIDCAMASAPDVVAPLRPRDDDYFVVKPQFSGFYATSLPVLLPRLGVTRLILTGIATDICVLFTAADAHMRDYELWAPEDCVAAESDERGRWALEIMASSMAAHTGVSSPDALHDWLAAGGHGERSEGR